MSGESRDKFCERIAALAGRTTYREPMGGRATGSVLTDQDVAAAVAMGRRRFRNGEIDDKDIGPEILWGMHTQTRHRKPDVCQRVCEMILSHIHGKHRFRVAKAVNVAYEAVVMGEKLEPPEDVPAATWATLYVSAASIIWNESTEALMRAERAFRRDAA